MILEENKFGYDPDNYDDEPSDYVNSDNAYDADDLSRDSAEEFEEEEDDDVASVEEDDDDLTAIEDDDDDLEDEVLDDEDEDTLDEETDVDENDPINDDVSDYPSSNDPEAFNEDGRKGVYINEMPYIDAR